MEKRTSSTNLLGPHSPERHHILRNVKYWRDFTLQSVNPALMNRSTATSLYFFAAELREQAHRIPKMNDFIDILTFKLKHEFLAFFNSIL